MTLKKTLSFRKATTLKVAVCRLLTSFFSGISLAASWTSCFTSTRWACLWQPNGWQRRTAWWRTWKLWKRLALLPSSALTRQGPSRRTGWLLPTSGLIIKSTQLIPVKIKQVNMAVGGSRKGWLCGMFPTYSLSNWCQWGYLFRDETYTSLPHTSAVCNRKIPSLPHRDENRIIPITRE